MYDLSSLDALFETNKNQILNDYFELLRFKTIAADESSKGEMIGCVLWLKNYLTNAGFSAEIIHASPHPQIVLASWDKAGKTKPTILLYGHYDVQPVDPLELWTTPPFEPHIRDNKVYARGANDDKGQFFSVISAVVCILKKEGTLPVNVKIILEGDEEIGSLGLTKIVSSIQDKIKADYLAVIDVGIKSENQPSVTVGTRGVVSLTLELTEGNTDLHSGLFGGIAYNPNRALAEIIASFYDKNGKVLVPGFYDDVEMPPLDELKVLDMEVDKSVLKSQYDLDGTGGEQEFELGVRRNLRPTLEINGISGGYSGSGIKTVIPQKAIAKISARIVKNQNGRKVVQAICDHIKAKMPPGIKYSFIIHENDSMAFRSSPDSKICKACNSAFSEVCNKECITVLNGATIPIVPFLTQYSGAETVLIGYGLDSDKVHAPNEHFGLDRFKKSFLTAGLILRELV